MPTITSGDLTTVGSSGNVLSTLRVIAMRDEIFSYDPSATPYTLLMNEVDRSSVDNPEFKWHETERFPTLDRVNNSGGYTAGATSVVVDNGSYFPKNSVAQVSRTGECLLVTAISTNTLTVTRAFGGTAAAALLDNDQLVMLGGRAAESATAETSLSVQEVQKTNYTQIVRTPFGVSGTTMASNLYGGGMLSRLHKERGIDHAIAIEQSALWSEKKEDTTNKRRSSGGINELISTNSVDMGGSLSLVDMFDLAEDAFRYGRKTKLLLCSRSVTSNISLLAKDALRKADEAQRFGINMERLVTPHGTFLITAHDLFVGDEYAKYGLIIDLDNVAYRYLSQGGENRDTMLRMNIQAPDADLRKDEYLTEFGFERRLEKTHARMKNASSG